MEILLFITAILVNGAGAFVSVVAVTGLDSLSFAAIIHEFSTIPATSQAALVMAALSALIIPIGTLVAGDGLADLTLQKRENTDFREVKWQEVEYEVIYRAVFVQYMQQGLTEKSARKRSLSAVHGYLGSVQTSSVRLLSAPSEQTGQSAHNGHHANGQSGSVKETINEFLDTHPEVSELSVNGVLDALQEAEVKAGRTSVAEVLRERRLAEHNSQ